LAGTFPASGQNTIHVPGDQPTIQAAITAAANGDTVLVAPGSYKENIDFRGKAITVTSSAGPASTTIDGGQNGVVVTFQTNETRSSTLNGFTITDNAPPLPTQFSVVADGILVTSANPTITGNIITGNRGYGIEVYTGGALISGNTISHTVTAGDPSQDFGCDYIDGSGIYVFGGSTDPTVDIQITNNVIEFNRAQCYGGAIFYNYSGASVIANNTLRYNVALGEGGAIYVYASNVSFVQNLIVGNTSGAGGGGIYLQIISEVNGNTGPLNQFLVNNTFVGNTINPNPDIFDFYTDGSQVAFGGYVSQVGFFNNIMISGDTYGEIGCDPNYQYLSGAPPTFNNNDILNFSGARFGGWCPDQTGTKGNISANPLFIAVNSEPYHLQTGSPTVDSGDNTAPDLPSQDIDGNPRTQNGTVNMGVYEGASPPSGTPPSPNFSLTASPTSLTIANGQSGQVTLTISPSGGYIGAFSLSCGTPPAGMSCYFGSPLLASGGDNQQLTTTLTISVSVATPSVAVSRGVPENKSLRASLILTALFSMACLAFFCSMHTSKRFRYAVPSTALPVIILIGMGLFSTACGGGQSSSPPPSPPPTSETLNLGITASSMGNATAPSHSLNFPVTINF